ncbi:COP9 signalosome complex subunit 4 [Toxocara canis]|uniref:COP9 signalosome complex subunit 4 n=1 Tax=Toxocara canis TaxID=6265 RepID=A0A0B2V7P5_TOXCA|nr:COP9 signalosome complex subunit 4 [Toxocara canis]
MADDMVSAVTSIFAGESDHKIQSEKLKALLLEILSLQSNEDTISNNVNKLAEAVVNQESVSMVVSRQFVSDVVTAMEQLAPSIVKKIAIGLLSTIHSRHISYEEQSAKLRFKLADIYEMEGENREAAKTLMAIPLETGQRSYPAELKMRTYLRIAQLALEYGDAADAEAFVNRASMLQNDAKNEQLNVMYKAQYARVLDHRRKFIEAAQRSYPAELKMRTYLRIAQLALEYGDAADAEAFVNRASMLQNDAKNEQLNVMYKAQYARVLDHRRKFIEAAQRYYELSLVPLLTNSEKMQALMNAVACAILASPGVQRSRMLTTLFKDERCERLSSHSVLQKMHLERLIRHDEVSEFEKSLAPHQREVHDGCSILQRAVVEHNVIAVSNIFTSINFDSLAHLLEVDVKRAEKVTWQMIAEKRISGSVDQLDGFVHFKRKEALVEWDEQIGELCQHINRIADMIVEQHKEWAEARIESRPAATT